MFGEVNDLWLTRLRSAVTQFFVTVWRTVAKGLTWDRASPVDYPAAGRGFPT